MSTNFESLLPFLAALKRAPNIPSQDDEDESNLAANQFVGAASDGSNQPGQVNFESLLPFLAALKRKQSTPSPQNEDENDPALMPSQSNPMGDVQAQLSPDRRGLQLMQLLQSGLQGSNPNRAGQTLNQPMQRSYDETAAELQPSDYDLGADDMLLQRAPEEPEFADPANEMVAAVQQNPLALLQPQGQRPQQPAARPQQQRPQQPTAPPQTAPPRQPARGGQPQQPATLTAAEQQAAAAVAYSELTRGTVAEHEAVISVIANRARSGERQYVGRGQDVNVNNVIHAPGQFQGVGGPNEQGFERRNDQGAQNARTAAANVAQNGPTNNATAYLATNGDEPTARQIRALGNVHAVGRVGNVFLYAPGPAPAAPAR